MERLPVKSSNIKTIGYDEATKTLEIEFTNSGVYQYKGVPKEIYEGFDKAESIGKYFYANVKSNRTFKFEKVVTILKPEDVEFKGVSIVSNPEKGCEAGIVIENIKKDLEVIKIPYEGEDNQVRNA